MILWKLFMYSLHEWPSRVMTSVQFKLCRFSSSDWERTIMESYIYQIESTGTREEAFFWILLLFFWAKAYGSFPFLKIRSWNIWIQKTWVSDFFSFLPSVLHFHRVSFHEMFAFYSLQIAWWNFLQEQRQFRSCWKLYIIYNTTVVAI